jgi:hypothetical protein
MSAELAKRADELRAKYKVLEGIPGTGHHDNDRNPARADLFAAPQKAPDPNRPGHTLPRASEHLVPFYDHDGEEAVHFVGADAEAAHKALSGWAARYKGKDPSGLPGTERKLILRIVPRLAVGAADGLPRLTVRLADWNDVVYALYQMGVGLSGQPLVPPEA